MDNNIFTVNDSNNSDNDNNNSDTNDDPNYNVDQFGRRRGLRRRKKRITFYDTYREEQDQLDKAKAPKTTTNKETNTNNKQPPSQLSYKTTKAEKRVR